MKLHLLSFWVVSWACSLHGQGFFQFSNTHAPTHLYTIDGPLAGPEIYAQMLVGRTESSLEPIWHSVAHIGQGIAVNQVVDVPGSYPGELVYIQMVVWDSRLWGTALADVPENQLGMTDVVPHYLSGGTLPAFAPDFTRSAVVPVPEPSFPVLILLGIGVVWFIARCSGVSS